MQIPLWVLGIVSPIITSADGLGPPTICSPRQFLDTIRCPRAGCIVDMVFGLGLDTYTEEVVFRRCARQVFEPYVGDRVLLVLVTSLLFGVSHWWSGLGNVLAAMLMGVLFMLFYQRSGSLWPVVLSHCRADVADFA
jgi:membrane protease YdiL (CAAX protease family)